MRFIARVTALAVVATVVAACSPTPDDEAPAPHEFPEGSTMRALAEAGEITIGTKFDQPLFGALDGDGTPQGFDVEIGTIIAAELGIAADAINWEEALSNDREQHIEDGTVDLVIATYTINDERKERVAFAGPYFRAQQALMTLTDNDQITGTADLAGQNVCSVQGSTPAIEIRNNYADANLVLFGAYSSCLEPLRNGQVDAVATDNVILAGYVSESDGQFKIVGEPFTDEPYGVGLRHDDLEFRDWINDVLEAAYEDGRWLDAWNRTAGTTLSPPEPPAVERY